MKSKVLNLITADRFKALALQAAFENRDPDAVLDACVKRASGAHENNEAADVALAAIYFCTAAGSQAGDAIAAAYASASEPVKPRKVEKGARAPAATEP